MRFKNSITEALSEIGDLNNPERIEREFEGRLLSKKIDVLSDDFKKYFREKFPEAEIVVVFDKDDTFIKTNRHGKRALDLNLTDEVLMKFALFKPKVCLVQYTIDDNKGSLEHYKKYPVYLRAFDLIISGDNISSENLEILKSKDLICSGKNAYELEAERMLKPVSKIFDGYPVVLLDDLVGEKYEHGGSVLKIVEGLSGVRAPEKMLSIEEAREINLQIRALLNKQDLLRAC